MFERPSERETGMPVALPGMPIRPGSTALQDARARTRRTGRGADPAQRHLARTVTEAEQAVVDESVVLPHWARLAPGPELAAELARLAEGPAADLDGAGQVELIAAYERLRGWVEAGQLAAIADLAARRRLPVDPEVGADVPGIDVPGADVPGADGPGADVPALVGTGLADPALVDGDPTASWREHGLHGAEWVSEFVADEIGARLAWSRHFAAERLLAALDLTLRLPGTFTALRAGTIEPRKALAVARAVRQLDDQELVDAVEDRVLPEAPRLTVGQLIDRLRREVLALDPDGAGTRSALARSGRRVQLFPEEDAMATLRAQGPADAALAVYSCLDLMARHGCAPGDERTMDQRRYDALAWLVTTHPAIAGDSACQDVSAPAVPGVAPVHPEGPSPVATPNEDPALDSPGPGSLGFRPPAPHGVGSTGRMRPLVQLTVSEATMLAVRQAPGHLAGYGPVCAEVAREIASDADWRRLLTDPVTGAVLAMDTATHDPPASVAALVAARDQTCAFPTCRRRAEACDQDHVVPWPRGRTSPDNLLSECRSHHRLKHLAGWSLALREGRWTWRSPTGHLYRLDPVAVGSAMDSVSRGAGLSLQEEPRDLAFEPAPEVDLDDLLAAGQPADLLDAR